MRITPIPVTGIYYLDLKINMIKICVQCGSIPQKKAFKVCSRCRQYSYCSPSCQKEHWKLHKHTCNDSNATGAAIASKNIMKTISKATPIWRLRIWTRVYSIYRCGLFPKIEYSEGDTSEIEALLYMIIPCPSIPIGKPHIDVYNDRPLFIIARPCCDYMTYGTCIDDIICRYAIRYYNRGFNISEGDIQHLLTGSSSLTLPSGFTIDRDDAKLEYGLVLIMIQWHLIPRNINDSDEDHLDACINMIKSLREISNADIDLTINSLTISMCKLYSLRDIISML